MARHFPKPRDGYPIVYLEDTDLELPEHVVNNTMRYTQFKTIAKGGKCIIQSCKDYHLSRIVAHKSLHKEIADDPFERKRFLREARVTAMLQHPNTVPIYELSRDNRGRYFFTMKLVEGFTLREIMELDGEQDSAPVDGYGFHRFVTILIQVGNALDYAHNHRVVHRDIKPANILMGPFGEVLLLDWGLAKVWGPNAEEISGEPIRAEIEPSLTAQGRLQGSALYMSPEQINEAPDLDHRSDIYSLGVVLYEILTGTQMVKGATLDELLENAKHVMPAPPSVVQPERSIPEELENICMRCIQKDPDKRIQTATQLVSALRAWRIRWSSGAR